MYLDIVRKKVVAQMFNTIIIIILLVIIIYLILDKKNIKKEDLNLFLQKLKEKAESQKRKFQKWNTERIKKQEEKNREKNERRQERKRIKKEQAEEKMHSQNNYQNFSQNNGGNIQRETKIVKKSGCLSKLLVFVFLIFVAVFGYKKIAIDYNGEYATDRIIWTDDYGFCLLITYHPKYQINEVSGFAVPHIPFTSLFTKKLRADRNGNDTADSKDMYESYQLLAAFTDNNLVDSLSRMFVEDPVGRSVQIGNRGKYFVLDADDFGL